MSIITLTFIEMINHLLINYQNQIDNIEMQKIIIVSLNKFDLNHLKQGVNIDDFTIKLSNEKFVPQTTKIKSAIVLKNKLPSFTFIEMIFSLMITTILLTSVPLTIKMIGQYKQIALENSSIEYEFFHSDF
ncbi:hypothetical protein ACO2FJ_10315 [Staphylococcus warneri]